MATYTLAPVPGQTFLSDTGAIVPGGLIYTYLSGTSTLSPTYTVQDGSVQQTNPIVLDGFGRVPSEIYIPPGVTQKWVFQTPGGATIRTYPTVAAVPTSSNNVDVQDTVGEAIAAGQAVYLSDGSGSKSAGQWYRADATNAYSSTLNVVGMVPSAIASGASGTIRQAGIITGLSSLTVGALYYISSTPGTLTTTPGGRLMGQADSATSLILSPNPPPLLVDNSVCDGRLTATSGTPVTTSDVSGATSIYWTPYRGNRIALYDGLATWNIRTFSEITIALTGLTASKPYDIFAYDNAGTVTIETLVWTNTTTRATALILQNGVLVKSGATTRRYLGTVYINATGGQTDDTALKRYIWNYYYQKKRSLSRVDTTDTWTYTTATIRQANGSAANQVEVVIGVQEAEIDLTLVVSAANSGSNVRLHAGIGEDSTTTFAAENMRGRIDTAVANLYEVFSSRLTKSPAVGYHFYAWLEYSAAAGTTTWIGDGGASALEQSGLVGWVEG